MDISDGGPSGPTHLHGHAGGNDADLGRRVGAVLLDGLIVGLPIYLVGALLFGDSEASDQRVAVSLTGLPFLLVTLVVLAYFVICEATTGQTLGKRIVGIRVVSEKGDLSWGPSIIRNVVRIADALFCYAVGFFVALASKKNQRLGDMAASTRVVRAR